MAPRRTGDPLRIVRGLYVYWRILGLCPFVPVEGGEILRLSYVGVVYTTIITLAYFATYVRAIASRMNFILSRETSMYMISDISGATVEFLVIVAAWLGFALRQNELKRVLKGLKNIHVIFKDIGIDQDFGRIVTTAKIHTLFVNITWVALFCCDHALLAHNAAFELAIWIPFNFPRIITHNVMIMFIDAMLIVNKLFCLLNEKIYDLSNAVTSRPRLIVGRNRRGSNNCCFESVLRLDPLEAYGDIHSDLVILTKMIVDFFSLSIILTLIVNFIQMGSDFYIVCVLARDSIFANWRERVTLATRFCWGCVHFAETAIMMAVSDSTTNEANRAGSVLHKMLTSAHTENYLAPAQILSFRLLRRRLKIEVYGLFEMRLSMLHGVKLTRINLTSVEHFLVICGLSGCVFVNQIISMVGTYITVAMQLDAQDILQKKFGSEFESWNSSTTESH